jgi:hypoxanthine-guanine phosphoribosyltransferase
VLIVEDIVDSGLTLNYLLKNLRSRRPATLECACCSASRMSSASTCP